MCTPIITNVYTNHEFICCFRTIFAASGFYKDPTRFPSTLSSTLVLYSYL